MQLSIRKILISVIMCVLHAYATAQVFPFQNFTVENGLPQSIVYCIHEDSKGYLWAGTQGGVCSFDGKDFKVFDAQKGLTDNHVTAIAEDSTGALLLGHRSGTISYLKNGKLSSITKARFNDAVNSILITGNRTWIGTEGSGVFVMEFHRQDTIIKNITTKQGLPSDIINRIINDANGEIILATNNGVVSINTRTHKPSFPKAFIKTKDMVVNAVYKVSSEEYLLGTTSGAWRLSPTALPVLQDVFNKKQPCSEEVTDIIKDSAGNIWLATTSGITKVNDNIVCYRKDNGILSDEVNMILEDRDNNIWFSQDDGLSRYRDDRCVLYDSRTGLVNNEVYGITEPSPGVLWIGTADGISIFDKKKGAVIQNLTTKEGLPGNFILNLFTDSRKNIWIGTSDFGAAMYDLQTKRFKYFNAKTGLQGKNAVSIREDKNGKIWIATLDGGIASYSYEDNSITNFNKKSNFFTNSVWTIFRDHDGELWFGSNDKGLIRYNAENATFTNVTANVKLINNSIGSITEDSKGNLWIASIGGGVYKYDRNAFTHYGTSIGLKTNNPYFIFCDPNDVLWLGTNIGMDRFDPEKNEVITYGKDDGFLGLETNQSAVYMDAEGVMWVGTVRGLVRFDEGRIKRIKQPPLVDIIKTSIFFNDTTLQQKVVLPYNFNHLTFAFNAVSLTDAENVRYSYLLQGFDKDWSPLLQNDRITYAMLPSGKYTFSVKAAYNNQPALASVASFNFVITPPYWKTLWFIGACCIVIGLLGVAGYRWRIHKVLKAERDRTAVELEIAELKMNALRAQMNPHFIFNCLNSIQYFITINEKESAIAYLSKFSLLIRRILENSSSNSVVLSDEIDMLRHYIEMEKLRLEDRFDYTINVDPSIAANSIHIPSLLIQPYVENAIIHGLKTKNHDGMLTINLNKVDGHLLCVIEDNGIGRKKSEELNKKKKIYHQSTGLSISKKRIEILQKGIEGSERADIRIIDLTNAEGNATGTRVEITIPLNYNHSLTSN
jgi:ligand-binding sensor domain-containing protein